MSFETTPWDKLDWAEVVAGDFDDEVLYETEIPVSGECPDISSLVLKRPKSSKLLVLFSSGRPAKTYNREAHYELWKQSAGFEGYNLLYLSDPVLKTKGAEALTFGVHSDFDSIAGFSEAIERMRLVLGLEYSGIVLYGYSQGGFLALQTASTLPNLRVIARGPIVDVERSSSPREVEHIRKNAVGDTWQAFRETYAERVSVMARFRHEMRIPAISISTNRADYSLEQAVDLLSELADASDQMDQVGSLSLHIDPFPQGHFPMSASDIVAADARWKAFPAEYTIGRESVLAESTRGRSVIPDSRELIAAESLEGDGPIELSRFTQWFSLEPARRSVTLKISFEGGSAAQKAGLLIAFSIDGILLSDMHRIPLTFSEIPSVGWYKYLDSGIGVFEREVKLNVPAHCSLPAVGLRLWSYKGNSISVRSIESF